MRRALSLSMILSILVTFAPQNLYAKHATTAVITSAACFGVFSGAAMLATLVLGVTASCLPPTCDPNSEYNITNPQTTTWPCKKCTCTGGHSWNCHETCIDTTCSQTTIWCDNTNGTQISSQTSNNPQYRTLIWATIGTGVAAGVFLAVSISSCISLCVLLGSAG